MLVSGMAEEGGGKTGHSLRVERNWKVSRALQLVKVKSIRLEMLAPVLRARPLKVTS